MTRIVVIGATRQIGSELVPELRRRYGEREVLAVGHARDPGALGPPYARLDVRDAAALQALLHEHMPSRIFHLASLLSATSEARPLDAWAINVDGLRHVLELASKIPGARVLWPSSIAAYGPDAPKDLTPGDVALRPTTLYGVTKVTGELLCAWWRGRGLDVRSLRYPGVIGPGTEPGGGTTDYAVAIFHAALRDRRYECFVSENTTLPMIYAPDCVRAAIDFLEAEAPAHRIGVNVSGPSFSAGELARRVAARVEGFACTYRPDFRDQIARSWPRSLDDSIARAEWGWSPRYDLEAICDDMIASLRAR
ncbi:MAG: NAD-dependent epimerase/dehydratase family protein [Sandaracinaceae bacterium]|nr:NAD-dependent epimerase/dehydratase family protein [Sandaracinaceae bacterium]